MKMIKNFVKLLGFFVVVAVAPLQNEANAIKIADVPSAVYTINSDTNNFQSNLFMNDNGRFFLSNSVFSTYIKSYSSYAIQFGSNPSHAQFTWVKVSKDNSNLTVQLWHEGIKDWVSYVLPLNGLNFTFKNGENALLNNIFFWHDSIILYDDSFTHTLQYIGSVAIEYVVFLTDPLQSTTSNNFWLIDFLGKKAYSTTLGSGVLNDLFFGQNFTNYNFQSINYDYSYSLTRSTGGVWFPSQMNMYQKSINYTPWHFDNDDSFSYIVDSTTIQPDYGTNDNNNLNGNNNYFNTALITQYNDCVNKGENLRKALHLAVMCKNQDPNTERENLIYITGLNYTGTASYCIQLDQYITTLYQYYSGNWATGVFSYDINLQDNTAPINQLIFAWYYNSVVVDLNGQISGLPNGNNWCSAWTTSNFYNNEKTFIEKVGDSLNDFFGSGVVGTYFDSVQEHASFSGLITSIKEGTDGFFGSYMFQPYQQQFNSGYNSFHTQLGVVSCTDINSSFSGMPFGNIALYVVSAILIFILLMFL